MDLKLVYLLSRNLYRDPDPEMRILLSQFIECPRNTWNLRMLYCRQAVLRICSLETSYVFSLV